MEPQYREYFNFVKKFNQQLTKDDFNLLYQISTPVQFKSNDVFVEYGKTPEYIYLLTKGVVRSFIVKECGKEITKSLFTEMELCSSLTALLKQEPSKVIYEALTDCHMMRLSFIKFKELCNSNIEIMKAYLGYFETIYAVNETEYFEVLSMDSKMRYFGLRKRIPNIDNLIPQYQIASYLNITPVQLSRIRASMKNKLTYVNDNDDPIS